MADVRNSDVAAHTTQDICGCGHEHTAGRVGSCSKFTCPCNRWHPPEEEGGDRNVSPRPESAPPEGVAEGVAATAEPLIGQEEFDRDKRIFDRGRASAGLTFSRLNAENVARCRRWHPGFPEDDTWNGADWSNAMCGEAGEAANIVKKLRRIETGHVGTRPIEHDALLEALALELADVVTYADLLASKYGIDLQAAVVRKFDEVSERQGFPERLS